MVMVEDHPNEGFAKVSSGRRSYALNNFSTHRSAVLTNSCFLISFVFENLEPGQPMQRTIKGFQFSKTVLDSLFSIYSRRTTFENVRRHVDWIRTGIYPRPEP
jgi:hypothetical protein